jgi:hypothetical protein
MNSPRKVLLLCIVFVIPSLNADYQSGLDAYQAGDYTTAMQEWQEFAAAPRTSLRPAIYAETYYAIAMLYWQGQGVHRDYYQARDWLVRAAEFNHAGAQAKLGYLYSDGVAVPKDLDQAFGWFSQAARQGDVDGQYNLGVFYLNGWGTEKDETMGMQYLAAASAQGDEAAEAALQNLLPQSPDLHAPLVQEEPWILEQNPGHYTLQIIALSTREQIDSLVADYNQLTPFAIYTAGSTDKPLYVLVQGNYVDLDVARQARDAFPEMIQDRDKLWVRKFAKVQELVRE